MSTTADSMTWFLTTEAVPSALPVDNSAVHLK